MYLKAIMLYALLTMKTYTNLKLRSNNECINRKTNRDESLARVYVR